MPQQIAKPYRYRSCPVRSARMASHSASAMMNVPIEYTSAIALCSQNTQPVPSTTTAIAAARRSSSQATRKAYSVTSVATAHNVEYNPAANAGSTLSPRNNVTNNDPLKAYSG